jgi:hypothetical protein
MTRLAAASIVHILSYNHDVQILKATGMKNAAENGRGTYMCMLVAQQSQMQAM